MLCDGNLAYLPLCNKLSIRSIPATGLGTSTSKEAKEYFSDMTRHKIPFRYSGAEDDTSITLAFSKKCIEDRKEWLTNWMKARKTRQELGGCSFSLHSGQCSRKCCLSVG